MPTDDPMARPGESGAVLVEAAIVVVVLLALIGGIVEVGSVSRARVALERLSSSAARVTAMGSLSASSDLEMLRTVGESLNTLPGVALRRVVVFRSDSPSGAPPPACDGLQPLGATAAGVPGLCNVYGPAHVEAVLSPSQPPTGCSPPSWEAAWCPASRDRQHPGGDHAGVLIEIEQYPLAAGLFTSRARLLTTTAVVLLEPEGR